MRGLKIKQREVADHLLTVLLLFMVAMVVWGVLTALRPYNILHHEIVPFEVMQDTVVAGEHFDLHVKFCKSGNYKSTIESQLVDGFVIFYPTQSSTLSEGCYDFVSEKKIPANTPTGTYFYSEVITYKTNNPFKPEVKYTFKSETFNIINSVLSD